MAGVQVRGWVRQVSFGDIDSDRAADDIGRSEYTPANVAAMRAVVESCAFTTTALAALARAVDEMGSEAQAAMIRDFCVKFAQLEASEI